MSFRSNVQRAGATTTRYSGTANVSARKKPLGQASITRAGEVVIKQGSQTTYIPPATFSSGKKAYERYERIKSAQGDSAASQMAKEVAQGNLRTQGIIKPSIQRPQARMQTIQGSIGVKGNLASGIQTTSQAPLQPSMERERFITIVPKQPTETMAQRLKRSPPNVESYMMVNEQPVIGMSSGFAKKYEEALPELMKPQEIRVPRKYWGTSSAKYGEVNEIGQIISPAAGMVAAEQSFAPQQAAFGKTLYEPAKPKGLTPFRMPESSFGGGGGLVAAALINRNAIDERIALGFNKIGIAQPVKAGDIGMGVEERKENIAWAEKKLEESKNPILRGWAHYTLFSEKKVAPFMLGAENEVRFQVREKFFTNVLIGAASYGAGAGLGYAGGTLGRVAAAGGKGSKAARITLRVAKSRALGYSLLGAYGVGVGLEVASKPAMYNKGQVIGRELVRLPIMAIGLQKGIKAGSKAEQSIAGSRLQSKLSKQMAGKLTTTENRELLRMAEANRDLSIQVVQRPIKGIKGKTLRISKAGQVKERGSMELMLGKPVRAKVQDLQANAIIMRTKFGKTTMILPRTGKLASKELAGVKRITISGQKARLVSKKDFNNLIKMFGQNKVVEVGKFGRLSGTTNGKVWYKKTMGIDVGKKPSTKALSRILGTEYHEARISKTTFDYMNINFGKSVVPKGGKGFRAAKPSIKRISYKPTLDYKTNLLQDRFYTQRQQAAEMIMKGKLDLNKLFGLKPKPYKVIVTKSGIYSSVYNPKTKIISTHFKPAKPPKQLTQLEMQSEIKKYDDYFKNLVKSGQMSKSELNDIFKQVGLKKVVKPKYVEVKSPSGLVSLQQVIVKPAKAGLISKVSVKPKSKTMDLNKILGGQVSRTKGKTAMTSKEYLSSLFGTKVGTSQAEKVSEKLRMASIGSQKQAMKYSVKGKTITKQKVSFKPVQIPKLIPKSTPIVVPDTMRITTPKTERITIPDVVPVPERPLPPPVYYPPRVPVEQSPPFGSALSGLGGFSTKGGNKNSFWYFERQHNIMSADKVMRMMFGGGRLPKKGRRK